MRMPFFALVVALSATAGELSAAESPTKGSSFAALPQKISSFGACVSDGWVYVYGGHTGKMHTYSTRDVTGRFFRARLQGGSWQELPAGPPVQGLALVAHKGYIYRIGGMQPRNAPGEKADNYSLTSVARFDTAAGRWQELTPLPEGRSSHEAVVVDDQLLVIGGWNMQGNKPPVWHRTALALDLNDSKSTWRSFEQPFARRALGAAVLDGKVYVLGGLTDKGEAVGRVDIYDPKTKSWHQGIDLPTAGRHGFSPAACTQSNALYFSGGDGLLHRLEAGKWLVVGKQAVKRLVHRLVPGNDGQIIVLGGNAPGNDSREVEVLRPQR